jgi:hypothetical protein
MNCPRTSLARLLLVALPCCIGCGEQASSTAPRAEAAIQPAGIASDATPAITAPPAAIAEMQPMGEEAAAKAATPVDTAPTKAPAAAAAKQPRREITFDNIKLAMTKDDKFDRKLITPEIEKLAGAPVKIRGWIHPNSVFQQSGITQFVLVRDNLECCFGPGAAIFDCIMVEMTPGHTADFTTRPIAVEGTFSIREVTAPWGALVAIYHLDAVGAK